MIDLSDGLSRDLRHICDQSNVGAVIEAARIPIHADVARADSMQSAIEHALHDGEDYELLFTSALDHSMHATKIGTIVAEMGMWLQATDGSRRILEARGWEHQL